MKCIPVLKWCSRQSYFSARLTGPADIETLLYAAKMALCICRTDWERVPFVSFFQKEVGIALLRRHSVTMCCKTPLDSSTHCPMPWPVANPQRSKSCHPSISPSPSPLPPQGIKGWHQPVNRWRVVAFVCRRPLGLVLPGSPLVASHARSKFRHAGRPS